MTNLFRSLCFAGLALTATATAMPAAAERGDHDTPATSGRWGDDTPWRYGSPSCRTDGDGWVVCRDRSGNWRRHHHEGSYGDSWWGNDDDDDWNGGRYGQRDMIDSRLVVRQLSRQGFEGMSDLKLRGDVYSLKATDPYGRRVIVQIDPYSGRIVNVLPR
ncbi:MAG: hypothetical protein ACREEV_20560 [Dongiaceae bacterium]